MMFLRRKSPRPTHVRFAFLCVLGMCGAYSVALASGGGAPNTVNFAGYLTNDVGAPITNATQLMRFSLYVGGTVAADRVWCASYSVDVESGNFAVALGSVSGTGYSGGTGYSDPTGTCTTTDASDLPLAQILLSTVDSSVPVSVGVEVWNGAAYEALASDFSVSSSLFALQAAAVGSLSESMIAQLNSAGDIIASGSTPVVDSSGNWIGGNITVPSGGNITLGGTTITNAGITTTSQIVVSATPTAPTDVANKQYVDTTLDGVVIATPSPLASGQVLEYNGASWVATTEGAGGGSGTVTSVGLSVPIWESVFNSPIATTGVLTVSSNSYAQSSVLAAPSSGAGTLSPRLLGISELTGIATSAQVPLLQALAGTATSNQIPLLQNIAGVATSGQLLPLQSLAGDLTVPLGGTGTASFATNGFLIGNGLGAVSAMPSPTVSGQVPFFTGATWGAQTLSFSNLTGTATSNQIPLLQNIAGVATSGQLLPLQSLAGDLTVPQGGTGLTSLSNGSILIGNGTNAPAQMPTPSVSGGVPVWTGAAWVSQSIGTLPTLLTMSSNVSITTNSGGLVSYGSTVSWTATSTGNILVTWYKVPPYVSGCAAGNLGFAFQLNGASGSISPMPFITNIARLATGDVVYPPLVDKFAVTSGTLYAISMQYFSQSFSSCAINTEGNSSGPEVFKIEYVN